jgi:hypothetical protein
MFYRTTKKQDSIGRVYLASHILYTDLDPDAPESIKDQNGQVVLSYCKVCGAGEAELYERFCTTPR